MIVLPCKTYPSRRQSWPSSTWHVAYKEIASVNHFMHGLDAEILSIRGAPAPSALQSIVQCK